MICFDVSCDYIIHHLRSLCSSALQNDASMPCVCECHVTTPAPPTVQSSTSSLHHSSMTTPLSAGPSSGVPSNPVAVGGVNLPHMILPIKNELLGDMNNSLASLKATNQIPLSNVSADNKSEAVKSEGVKGDGVKGEGVTGEGVTGEAVKSDSVRGDGVKSSEVIVLDNSLEEDFKKPKKRLRTPNVGATVSVCV